MKIEIKSESPALPDFFDSLLILFPNEGFVVLDLMCGLKVGES